jgi:hypothetical protein
MSEDPVSLFDAIPDAPSYSEAELRDCEHAGDFRPILFEHYKFVAQLCVLVSCLKVESPLWAGRQRRTWEVISGLFSRCYRLMSANLEFFQHGKYAEASYIIDRCILESAAKIRWIAQDKSDERATRFVQGSLKPELELFEKIQSNIADRGDTLVIETRMLSSIQNTFDVSGVTKSQISGLKKLPDLYSILNDIGETRLTYTIMGKIASHHVHGSWVSLLDSYLKSENGLFEPNHATLASRSPQYVFLPLFVLSAAQDYISHCFSASEQTNYLAELFLSSAEDIRKIGQVDSEEDFNIS